MNDTGMKQTEEYIERLKDAFDEMVVYKDLKNSNFISAFNLPSFMRDWVLKRFQDEDGVIDVEGASDFVKDFIPKKDDWKDILNRIVSYGETVKFLAKISINIDIKTREISFELPDFGLGFKDTIIPHDVWDSYSTDLLKSEENWGIIELSYQYPASPKEHGKIRLVSFQDFCPYTIDLDEYKYARENFSLTEWIDIVLGAIDNNPDGYESLEQKLAVLQRLLPFVEKRVNLLELAPPSTGKSYLFGQISRHGWLVSGKVTRAKLIYDIGKKKDGVVAVRDYVALDEIREAEYMQDAEIQSSLQAIMENGKYRAPDNHEVNVDAGIVFLGNVSSDAMNEYQNMFVELPKPFHQPQFLDRIHGFIKGWDLPRISENIKVCGWALNSEYFATVMHELRSDPTYRAIIDKLIILPKGADTRDTEAVKRICTAYLKLLFPNVRKVNDISSKDFKRFCLKPAMNMRSIIRMQMGYADDKHAGEMIPDFDVEECAE
ncbi:BREX system Lon protease-like protein BrxL [Caproiciproducens galactitolivorans]|uniref:BREX system Lon protease-like protein BrxL n=1 Tax=Caproiciproducens galactitolivorans TaxID=642589 RepID=A0ABT4BX55_9FIRM|nr:BREX system Lon protease-like protein BrxL [Caproiciproducens galactitolivorans]MCY1714910.1 BREX system Lon protease-like protein BrxL [Caproiciproducens galactitolivorans]